MQTMQTIQNAIAGKLTQSASTRTQPVFNTPIVIPRAAASFRPPQYPVSS